MTKSINLHMEEEWLNGAQAISLAFELASKYMFGNTYIGFELMGDGHRRHSFVLHSEDINLKTIQDKTGLHDYDALTDITVYDLKDKEYEVTRYGIEVKRGYEKLYDLLEGREYGHYLAINGDDIFEIEYIEKHDGIMKKRTFKDFKNVVERVEDAITSKLQVLHVPKYHMWKKYSYERYPDDPGCGIYGYYVKIFDKATGVEYKDG